MSWLVSGGGSIEWGTAVDSEGVGLWRPELDEAPAELEVCEDSMYWKSSSLAKDDGAEASALPFAALDDDSFMAMLEVALGGLICAISSVESEAE
jgi:hypothetical protein